jgi:diadenosine tetraphosphate (Ap4A) HIT family hydrolase
MSDQARIVRPGCPLCEGDGGTVIARTGELRVVQVEEAEFEDYPGYLRVIWNSHAAELSELAADERERLMTAVAQLESAMRRILEPDKVNLASLGNMVPHLHWHLIARYRDDVHYPGPVWAARRRQPDPGRLALRRERMDELVATIRSGGVTG